MDVIFEAQRTVRSVPRARCRSDRQREGQRLSKFRQLSGRETVALAELDRAGTQNLKRLSPTSVAACGSSDAFSVR
jgi:hypothetical protein